MDINYVLSDVNYTIDKNQIYQGNRKINYLKIKIIKTRTVNKTHLPKTYHMTCNNKSLKQPKSS